MHKFLAMTLAVGNVLNGGTAKGQADGFGIDVLASKLQIKDNQGHTLLAYVVKQLVAKDKEYPTKAQKLHAKLQSSKKNYNISEPYDRLHHVFNDA